MLGELIAISAVLTFVGSNVMFRKVENEVTPLFINFFRTAIGTLSFILIALFINSLNLIFLIPAELWILLILSFVFGQVIGDTAYFTAQKDLGTTIALAISMTFPLFTFIFSLIFLGRQFRLNLIFSLILIGIGIMIIGKSKISHKNSIYEKNTSNKNSIKIRLQEFFSKDTIKATCFCFAASLGWAIGAVLIDFSISQIDQIIHTEELSSIIGNVIRFPFALLILGSMVLRENHLKNKNDDSLKQKMSRRSWIFLLVASIIGTSLGAYLYTESVHIAGANVVSLIASTAPLFALPLTYFINKEKITKWGFLGVILTILGVFFILF
ncbi:MAG: DMT family transporter [Candidatus Lokiarchaeota archaeon]|nr:DMT family transporter [Candidatus Lokiarchaeota archaeon]